MDSRNDAHGTPLWSHKPGRTTVTDLDNARQPITNPRTADRHMYTEFVGYMYSNPNINIAGPVRCWRRLLEHYLSHSR